jgi:hypothetical protein
MDKPASEQTLPEFSSTQTFAHTGITLQSDPNSASKPEPKPVPQAVDEPVAVSKSETGATTPEPSAFSRSPAQTSGLETQGISGSIQIWPNPTDPTNVDVVVFATTIHQLTSI